MSVTPQFDASLTEQRLVADRAKLRAEFRKEYVKQITNPHRHGHGGYLFDPAMQRWMSMRSQQYYYFKPNAKTAAYPVFVLLTCIAYGSLFNWHRDYNEKKYRSGQVSYRDRKYKFF